VERVSDRPCAEEGWQGRAVQGPASTPDIGQSLAIRRVQEQVRQVAETDATVLLLGETGPARKMNVFQIRVPPLRERSEDIPRLVWGFVEDLSKAFGKRIESVAKQNIVMLQRYVWPGNVRELRNVVERAVIVGNGPRLAIPLPSGAAVARPSERLADVEKEHIKGVLESTAWRIRGAGGAADRLGLKATTLETRMAKLGLHRPRH
jgi:formate hydrogenlyase transcriptional activator